LILKFQDVEKIINSEIITASIFIIDYRLLDENGNWWPYQGYEIIQKIAAKKPSARFFILSGKDEEFLLYIPSHISTKIFSFSKDLILKDQSKFDLFAKEIYDQIYTLILSSDFINRLIEKAILEKLIKDCEDRLNIQFDKKEFIKIIKSVIRSEEIDKEINKIKAIIKKIKNKNSKNISQAVENILKLIKEKMPEKNEILKKILELDNQEIQDEVFENLKPDGMLNPQFSPYKGEPNFEDDNSIKKWVITRSIIMCYSDYLEYVEGISNYEEKLNRIARDIMLREEGSSSGINNQKKMINNKLYLTEDSFKFEEGYLLPIEQKIRKIFISQFMENYIKEKFKEIKNVNEFEIIKEELSDLNKKIEKIGPDIIEMCKEIKKLDANDLIKNSINKFSLYFHRKKTKSFSRFKEQLRELVNLLESLLNFLNLESIIEKIKNILDLTAIYNTEQSYYTTPDGRTFPISIYTKREEKEIKMMVNEEIILDIIKEFPRKLYEKDEAEIFDDENALYKNVVDQLRLTNLPDDNDDNLVNY
jgi:biotin-(acetyl-CoA carboxylase) ligase